MRQFTKGKWKYLEATQCVTAYPEGPGNWPVIDGMPTYPDEQALWKDITGELCWNGEETDANGRLIAAAPEMYETLATLLEELPIIAGDSRHDALVLAMHEARKLLARIDGEEANHG